VEKLLYVKILITAVTTL